jgi:hypothetical protein
MKEKLTFNDIRPLIDGDPVAIFKDGWKEENLVYEDSLTYDDEKYQNFVKKYGDTPIRCISTSINTDDFDWTNIAILI